MKTLRGGCSSALHNGIVRRELSLLVTSVSTPLLLVLSAHDLSCCPRPARVIRQPRTKNGQNSRRETAHCPVPSALTDLILLRQSALQRWRGEPKLKRLTWPQRRRGVDLSCTCVSECPVASACRFLSRQRLPGLQTLRLIQPAILHCFPFADRRQLAVPRKPSPPSSPSVEMRRHLLTSPHRHFLQESWQRQGEGSLAGMAGFLPILVRRSGDSKAQRPHLATPTDA